MIPESIKKVLANVVQHFTESEKALARANIGAAAAEDITTDAVKYTAQTLTDPQKDQARQNIDAAKNALASSSNNGLMSSSDKAKLDGIQAGAEANVQADWNQSDASADDYIKNKPENLVQDANYVHTDNNFTTAEKTKLEGIEAGAEVNVQADWNQTDPTKDDYIKNKPVPVTDVTVDGTSVVSNGVAAIIKDAEIIVYGSTGAWAKLTAAIAANKVVVCRVNVTGSNYRVALLSYYNVSSGTAEFNFHRANPTKDYTTQNDEIYIYGLSSDDTWTTTQRSVAMKYQAGNGLDKAVTNNDNITFLVKPKTNGGITVDSNGVALDSSLKSKLDGIEAGAEVNVQSDWTQTNTSADDYIKNKPSNLVQDASYVHTDNNFTTALKDKLDGIAAGAEVNVQSDWNQSNSSADDYIKNKPVVDQSYSASSTNAQSGTAVAEAIANVDTSLFEALYGSTTYADIAQAITDKKIVYCRVSAYTASSRMAFLAYIGLGSTGKIEFQYYRSNSDPTANDSVFVYAVDANNHWTTTERAVEKIQANWTESDSSAVSYIKNKPTNLVQDASYVHTDNNFTTTLKDKLDGIASGAEVNVQADWNQSDSTKDDYIKNKPTIVGQVNSNWTASSGIAQILNKPNFQRVVYGGTASELTGLRFDADDPEGYIRVLLDSDQQPTGQLVAGPYKALLDSGVSGLGDSSEGVYIDSDGTFKKCTKNVVFVGLSTSYADVLAHVNANREVILRYDSTGNDLHQYFRLSQFNPDGSMEFTCVRGGTGYVIAYKYTLNTSGQWTRTDTSVSNYTGIQIDGIGRNLHLNQNNYVQTNFPGGMWTVNIAQDNIFYRFSGGGFNGAYYLAARYKTDGTYELGISYSGSGSSSTITFIGTETIIGLDHSATVKQALYVNEREYYTVSTRFGGSASTAFDPSRHNAIIYSGFGNIGPASDTKIVIWQEDNGTIKVGMTCIEVGKVGSTN